MRFAGDTLDPDEISRIVKEEPTRAYRKGQQYRPGPRSPEVTGKTGVWYFSTRRRIPGNDLADHLDKGARGKSGKTGRDGGAGAEGEAAAAEGHV